MTVDEMMEQIMDQVFAPGYLSPRTPTFYQLCKSLLDSTPAEKREEVATTVLNLCVLAKEDALESQ